MDIIELYLRMDIQEQEKLTQYKDKLITKNIKI